MRKNKAELIGNVGKDPEVLNFDGGSKKATLSLATTERYKNKQGERKESTQWHNIVAWGKTAEQIEKYVKKGDKIGVEGVIKYRKYQDREGNERQITEIEAYSVLFLSSKHQNEAAQPPEYPASTGPDGDADDLPF